MLIFTFRQISSMKAFLVILTVLVILTGLALGLSTSSPDLDTTGQFVIGGNLGLMMIIVIIVIITLVSLGAKFVSEF